MDFTDDRHNVAELVFHGTKEVDLEQACAKDIVQALAFWRNRPDHQSTGSDFLQLERCALFSISLEGEAKDYWPTESENNISETSIREFLYPRGICALSDERVRLFHVRYSIIALNGDEYLLVCPYLTAAGNTAGIVVVTVRKMTEIGHSD